MKPVDDMRTVLTGCLQQDCRSLMPALFLALLVLIPWISDAQEVSLRTPNEPISISQPLPFSHRSHTQLGLKCSVCHTIKGRGHSAGFPSLLVCLSCHRSGKGETSPIGILLEGYARRGETIPWVRVYKIPDFVFFSHKEHLTTGATCRVCHGPVELRERIVKEIPTSMKFCMDCHESQGASVACHFCHELNQ